ncbi:MAG: aspartate/glutamate racemase family protein [Bacteroidetes bacterium]|nr:aspartate/glutamate racemase family protein [Bacteroidota bacterium]
MKTIGMIGGTGWVSTVEYYRLINVITNERRGGLDFARCILYSLNYGDIDTLNKQGNRDGVLSMVINAAKSLEKAGVDGLALCANTLHFAVDALEKTIDLPIVHIAEATGHVILSRGMRKVGLLGTKQTMESDFYKSKLQEKGIECLVPELNDRNFINEIITTELFKSIFKDETRNRFLEIIQKLVNAGAEGIILGCTEIPLLVKQKDTEIPLFDTLHIHAEAIVDFILED